MENLEYYSTLNNVDFSVVTWIKKGIWIEVKQWTFFCCNYKIWGRIWS